MSEPIPLQSLDSNGVASEPATPSVLEASSTAEVLAPPPPAQDEPIKYGWVVVGACSAITFVFVGVTYSFGIVQAELQKQNLAPTSTISLLGGLTCSCIAIFAVINTRVIRLIGVRNMAFVGAFLLGFGNIASGWCTESIGLLFLCQGVIMGLGVSFCYTVCTTLPAQWIPPSRRGLSNGIVFFGGGIGGAVFSLTMDALNTHYGLANMFRIVGGISMALLIGASCLIKEREMPRVNAFIDWRLFKDLKFVLLFTSGAIGLFPLFVPPFFLPLYGTSLGLSASSSAALVAGYNLSSAVGRLGFGQLADVLGPINTLLVALCLGGVTFLAVWPFTATLAVLGIFIVLNGVANGAFFALAPTVVSSVFGGRMQMAMGMVVTGWAGGYLLGAPIAGWILDAFGSENKGVEGYKPAMWYAGSMALASAGLVATLRYNLTKKLWVKV